MGKTSTERRLRATLSSLQLFVSASALALLVCAAPAAAQNAGGKLPQMTKLSFGQTGLSLTAAPNLVANAKHFLQDENLDVDYVVSPQSAQVCQQILAGAVDIGDCSLNDILQIDEKSGASIILVSNQMVSALNYGLMTQPKIKTWADLKGQTIMVGGPKDNTVFFTRVMTRAHGLKDSDYDFLYAGASNARFAALKAGAVGAAMLTDPIDSQAELQGYNRLDNLRPKYLGAATYAGGGLVTTRAWAKAHPQILAAYIVAFKKTIAWIYDPKNKDEFFQILKARLNLTREAFDRSYDKNVVKNKMWSSDGGVIIDSGVQGVLNSLVDLGEISPPAPPASKFYDNAYVDMANKMYR